MRGVASATISTCAECGRSWTCDPAGPCWCKAVDPRLPLPVGASATCLCPCRLEELAGAETKGPRRAQT